jgi:hypothetical protein
MNERITQLAEQCRFEIQGINCEVLGQGFDEEKFAHMIVQECATVASDFIWDWDGDQGIKRVILKEFGVEE